MIATWTPHPARDNTCTHVGAETAAKWQALQWAKCPGAVHISVADPDGALVSEWTRGGGWTTPLAPLRTAMVA